MGSLVEAGTSFSAACEAASEKTGSSLALHACSE